MKTRNLKGTIAFGSLTATVALLAGLSNASAQATAPGAGSFPQSFLIPGTNTSLSIYGVIRSVWQDNIGGMHTGDTQTTGNTVPFHIAQLALSGPGAAGGISATTDQNALHAGLRQFGKASTVTFETRTPTDLGEVKTVLAMDFNLFSNQANYISGTSTNKPAAGSGNTDAPRLLWAYGTIGGWLIGQYNSNYADPTLFPDVTDSNFEPGQVSTANIRQSQIRYTYLAGNGITLSASLEEQESGTLWLTSSTGAPSSFVSDNTDVNGIVNLPSFNTGINYDQPWGHLMSRVGVSRNEIRNTQSGVSIFGNPNGSNNIKKWGWAAEVGGYLNTWGQDQWKWLINYSKGIANYSTDLSATSGGNMFCNGVGMGVNGGTRIAGSGTCNLIADLGMNTSYTHRFNPNWRMTAAFGMGFFWKPSAAAGLSNTAVGTAAAQLTALEKRHLASQLNVVWSPVPGLTDIYLEWDHWDRWVQASQTSGMSNKFGVGFSFYW